MFRTRVTLMASLLACHMAAGTLQAQETSRSAPFGIPFGATAKDLVPFAGLLSPGEQGLIRVHAAPKPVAEFDDYQVQISPTLGVCEVYGFGKSVAVNGFGEPIRASFDSLSKTLSAKYGEVYQYVDAAKTGSVWTGPTDWTMGLYVRERKVERIWLNPTAYPDIRAVWLFVSAESPLSARLTLAYFAKPDDGCDPKKPSKDRSGL
jgi:hypothetical protein